MKKKAIAKWLLVITLSAFPAYWFGSIAKCEILTLFYGEQFDGLQLQNTMFGDIDYLKVLDYSPDAAQIYYVSKGRTSGDILLFEKRGDQWVHTEWERTVWSKSGSADGFIWPYIR